MKEEYNDSDIQVLEGLEAVRKRPGMYIGTTSERGLHHLVWEIVDNSVDEALAGFCDDIEVVIEKNNVITVKDDGRGMPTGINQKTGLSTIETIFTVLHAGGKFGGGGYKVSGGLHGVGASVVNALSTWLEVRVYREGHVYFQRFENGGHPVGKLEIIDDCSPDRTGTTVSFKADPEKNKNVLHNDVVYVDGQENGISLEVAFQYSTEYSSQLYSFTNNISTYEGGTHEDGVKRALTRIINNYARNNKLLKEKDDALTGDDVREGLTMIISCKHPDPQFEGQTKTKLGNAEVRKIADDVFSEGLERFLMENPQEARIIIEKTIQASYARLAAKKARETVRKKDLDVSNFYGKLTDCSSKDPSECEIFIVEGDSAGGSAKEGRNSMTQAILPLRGKILNVEKARLDKALGNNEIKSIITAFGTGIGDEFNLEKLRYDKIIIMTDADVDGAHIRVLLLTLFYRFFRPIVEAGHVFAAQPPLFRITHGKNRKYVLTEAERDEYVAMLTENNVKFEIARMKGLGEMDAEELNETTMDIEKRVLKQITVEDARLADQVFSELMGDNVEERRKFIESNAQFVKNLDI